jgi:nucleolar protein 12
MAAPPKTFLTPQEKKRIAFIKHEIHSGVDSVNAYVVFAHPVPAESRPKNLPPPKHNMDPYEAARVAIEAADGSEFMGRTLRLDSAAKGKEKAVDTADVEMTGDPKSTIFVGNLDFACKEQDVRTFFEGLAVAERGTVPKDEGEKTWVKRVRIIRDKDTLLGKGFGYVQFVVRLLRCLTFTCRCRRAK